MLCRQRGADVTPSFHNYTGQKRADRPRENRKGYEWLYLYATEESARIKASYTRWVQQLFTCSWAVFYATTYPINRET